MIVFGTRARKIYVEDLLNVKCPSCGQNSSTEMYIFGKYFHIFWIPTFPVDRIGVSQCGHCKAVFENKNMQGELRQQYEAVRRSSKIPWWFFSGTFLIAGLVALGFISSAEDTAKYRTYIKNPQVGDVYYYRTESGNYSIEKVVALTPDSLEVELNSKEFTTTTGIKKIDRPENYEGFYEVFSKEDIVKKFNSGEIYEVVR